MNIKFRAWDIENKVMRPVGRLDFFTDGDIHINNHLPVSYKDHDFFYLMWFTGLKDSNGVEIYEGDIVRYNFGSAVIGIVKHGWASCMSVFYGWYVDLGEGRINYTFSENYQVIGNIHENPELLNGRGYENHRH